MKLIIRTFGSVKPTARRSTIDPSGFTGRVGVVKKSNFYKTIFHSRKPWPICAIFSVFNKIVFQHYRVAHYSTFDLSSDDCFCCFVEE